MSEIFYVIEKHRFEKSEDYIISPHSIIRKISLAIYEKNQAVKVKTYSHSKYVYVTSFTADNLEELRPDSVIIQNINDNGYTLLIDTKIL